MRHPEVKRIALIGSVPTGQRVQAAAAEVAVKHVSLELGGKNAMIVCPDADLDAVVEGASWPRRSGPAHRLSMTGGGAWPTSKCAWR